MDNPLHTKRELKFELCKKRTERKLYKKEDNERQIVEIPF